MSKPILSFVGVLGEELEKCRAEAEALVARRAIYDVQISAGRMYARVEGTNGTFISVECVFPVLPEKKAARLVGRIAQSALLYAHILEGEWSPELEALISEPDSWILPRSRDDIEFTSSGKPRKKLDASIAALLLVAIERFQNDPLQVFLLAGQGREELIARIRIARRQLSLENVEQLALDSLDLSPELLFDEAKFYNFPEEGLGISYQLKADELPAALLRRIEPPPLLGLEMSFEPELQEVYNRVTSRAQAYALQLAKERS